MRSVTGGARRRVRTTVALLAFTALPPSHGALPPVSQPKGVNATGRVTPVHRRSLRTIAASLTSVSLLISTMGTTLAVDPTGFTATALETDGAPIQAAKSRAGALAQTDPALLGRTDTTPIPVFIKLDYDAVASYAGDIAGLQATSPEVTGRSLEGESVSRRRLPSSCRRQRGAGTRGDRGCCPSIDNA